MIIDFHTHIFPEAIAERTIAKLESAANMKAATNGTLQGLLDSMEYAGIDKSVILPVVTKPDQFETVNQYAKFINDTYSERLLSFGGIHPDCENYRAKLDQIKAMGLKGIKIHPDYQGVMIDDVRYMNIIEYADEIGLIILTHAGIDVGLSDPIHCPPKKMRKVLEKLQPKKMVLGHYGAWRQWEEVYDVLAGMDVYFDTAFALDIIDQELFVKIMRKHGTDKILFATDSPWSCVKCGVEFMNGLPAGEEEIKSMLGGNAKALLEI